MFIKQKPKSDYLLDVTALAVAQGAFVSSSDPFAEGDGIFVIDSLSSAYNNYIIECPAYIAISSEDESVFTLEGNFAVRVSAGVSRIEINGVNHKQFLTLDFRGQGNSTRKRLTGFTASTLGHFTWSSIFEDLENATQANYYNHLSNQSGLAKNPLCWGADYDLSGVPISYLFGGFNGGGAMVTARHLIVSNHYDPRVKVGDEIKFLGIDGIVHARTIIAQTTGSDVPTQGIPNNPVLTIGDVCLFLLNSPLPSTVCIYPVVGPWVYKSVFERTDGDVSFFTNEISCAFITTNHQRKLLFSINSTIINNWSTPLDLTVSIGNGISYELSTGGRAVAKGSTINSFQQFAAFESKAWIGDSGSPIFVPLANHELGLFTVMTYPEAGTPLTESLLNALILEVDARAGISTGLTVTVATDPTL